jgi:uncharacterized protein YjbJ (UPF0337 family)
VNSDLLLGYAQTMGGRMVELTGRMIASPSLEAQGRARRAFGEMRHVLGRAKVAIKAHAR